MILALWNQEYLYYFKKDVKNADVVKIKERAKYFLDETAINKDVKCIKEQREWAEKTLSDF